MDFKKLLKMILLQLNSVKFPAGESLGDLLTTEKEKYVTGLFS